jgi:hypothetical protein
VLFLLPALRYMLEEGEEQEVQREVVAALPAVLRVELLAG